MLSWYCKPYISNLMKYLYIAIKEGILVKYFFYQSSFITNINFIVRSKKPLKRGFL